MSAEYNLGPLVNAGKSISEKNIRLIIQQTKKYELKPSFLIAQMFIESHWGDPNMSIVGSIDNNWSGISEPFTVPSDLGINMRRGSARPTGEGGYYVQFDTLEDYFKAYTFLLSYRNGLYNVEEKSTIEEFCKGLFRIGGARADYAASGYQHYLSMLVPTYNEINQQNPNKLETIDDSVINDERNEIGMFIYFQPRATGNASDMYGVWGNKRFHLNTMDKVGHFKNMVKDASGRDCKEYRWARGSEQIKTVESFTELQKTIV
jgi:hypothetical protein